MRLKKFALICLSASSALLGMAQSIGGNTTGSALYCDSLNSGFISLNAYSGQILYWQSRELNGLSWTNIPNPTSTQSYNKLMKTTSFRAVVQNGSFPADTSSASTITVYVPGHSGTLSGGGTFCHDAGAGTITLSGAPGTVSNWQSSTDNGSTWTSINHTLTTLNYSSILQNTNYRVVVNTIPGCPRDTTKSISYIIHSKSNAGNILKGDSLCLGAPGDTLRLSEFVGNILGWYQSTDNGANWISLVDTSTFITYTTVTTSVWYKTTVKNGICPIETSTPAIIAPYNANAANAGEDVTITRNQKITLNGKGNGFAQWSNPEYLSDAHSFNPIANPVNTTQYILNLTDIHGCHTSDTMNVSVIVPIPTIITPNGDGLNEFFEIDKVDEYPNSSLSILNRWGIEVYHSAPYKNEWNGVNKNGHNLPDDIYYFVLDYGNGEKATTNYILIQR